VSTLPRLRVFVHVGAPKTGTSAVQEVLFRNQEDLAAQGILYPAERFDEHFLAALDLMEMSWGGLEREAVGAWGRLAERIREWEGTAIVSHEILATASRAQVRRALGSFGDAEVHVVYSARDLVRQIPAEWQENVKHRTTIGYRDFLDTVQDPGRTGRLASWFWGVQEVPDVLSRWGSALPPERVHLVTVPRPGAPRDLLWQRFASVLGIDTDEFGSVGDRSNPSLGVAESVVMQRINERVNVGVLSNHHYRELVRELLAHRTLSTRTGSTRLALPPDVAAWAEELSESWVGSLERSGYDVVGALDELRPEPVSGSAGFVSPDAPDEAEVADATVEAVVALLREAARLREVEEALQGELDTVRRERDEAWAATGVIYRTKQRMVRAAGHNPLARAGLGVYRKVRGRSSRSA